MGGTCYYVLNDRKRYILADRGYFPVSGLCSTCSISMTVGGGGGGGGGGGMWISDWL